MLDHGLPALAALLIWWASTGAILYLGGLPRATHRVTFFAVTAIAGLAVYGFIESAGDTSVAGVYVGFASALMIWAWHETAFLLGILTGPRQAPCRDGCRGWRHALHATRSILYHEIAIALTAAALVAVAGGAANPTGLWTFLLLWGMRVSTKINLFLGVPNPPVEFLPDRLRHLADFMRKRAMNPLFPVTALLAAFVTAELVRAAVAAPSGGAEAVAFSLLVTFAALGALEHLFLVLPVPTSALWSWGFRSRSRVSSAGSVGVGIPVTGGRGSVN